MDEGVDVVALLSKLRESRLSTDERRHSLESLRQALVPLVASSFTDSTSDCTWIDTAIRDGPNDVRRVVLQTVSSHIDKEQINVTSKDQVLITVHSLFEAIEGFLRSTLKIQSSKSVSLSSPRSAFDISSLPTSALRATAAALKTLHALLRTLPKQTRTPSLKANTASKSPSLYGLFDVLLPCILAGIQIPRQALPRSGSSLQAGAFSWVQPSRPSHTASIRNDHSSSASTHNAARADHSSSGETDRKSDKSESERSDFSSASVSSIRSSKAESRQQESTTKLIRQNALHCLNELNRLESRSLISRWSDLLPDQPANKASDKLVPPVVSRHSTSSTAAAPSSLCTIMLTDPSTSVRLAAISALESILSHGTLQLSMAQERAQRALTFTSLSSQLAGWIVGIRSYLLVALQRAASAPRATVKAEGTAAETVGYPSSLTIASLQLTRTFVVSTAKAKLVTANAVVLGPAVVPFASHTDPDVQTAAKRLLAALSPASSVKLNRQPESPEIALPAAAEQSIAADRASLSGGGTLTELTALLCEEAVLSTSICERFVTAFEEAEDPVQHLPTWPLLVKALADGPSDLLSPGVSKRLVALWQKLGTRTCKTSDQQCATLSSVPDLWRVLSKGSVLDEELLSSILQYVQRCCANADEAIRAAAVRVLGLLVLPLDNMLHPTTGLFRSTADTAVQAILHDALWSGGLLHDKSSLVRQRVAWAFSNAVEARLRSATSLSSQQWLSYAQYCLEAGRDIEGVAVSACRASGSLLALLDPSASAEAGSLAVQLLEQQCRVLGTTSKPPKSRWNAASALERALSSDVVFHILWEKGDLLDRVVELLCTNLDAKVFKVRVSAANALLSLLVGADKDRLQVSNASRSKLLEGDRQKRISGFAAARLAELASTTAQSKESTLYIDELQRILSRLVVLTCSP